MVNTLILSGLENLNEKWEKWLVSFVISVCRNSFCYYNFGTHDRLYILF